MADDAAPAAAAAATDAPAVAATVPVAGDEKMVGKIRAISPLFGLVWVEFKSEALSFLLRFRRVIVSAHKLCLFR